jgi:hypothetical protein
MSRRQPPAKEQVCAVLAGITGALFKPNGKKEEDPPVEDEPAGEA